jgi:hypothetical protein
LASSHRPSLSNTPPAAYSSGTSRTRYPGGAALSQFSADMLQQALESASLEAMAAVRRRLPDLFARYVRNIDMPPGGAVARAAISTRPA